MMFEIEDLNISRYSAAQIEAVRPEMLRLAEIMRKNLALMDVLLGVEPRTADLAMDYGRLSAELYEAQGRIEAQEHDLATARAWIENLQEKLASVEDDEEERLFRRVGLAATAHTVVIAAARRALLQHHHPDRWPPDRKAAATVNFQTASAAFDKITEIRGC